MTSIRRMDRRGLWGALGLGILAGYAAAADPIDPPVLFFSPTTEVLDSLSLHLSGGGALRIQGERNFIGSAALGLGDIAQININTVSLINNFSNSQSAIPASGFRLQLLREGWGPAVTAALDIAPTLGISDDYVPDDPALKPIPVAYNTRFTSLFLNVGKTFGEARLYTGVRVIDTRLSDFAGGGVRNTGIRDSDSHTLALAMAGMKYWRNERTLVMLEALGVPDYDYNPTINSLGVKSAYAFAAGVRYFFTDWLAFDSGVKYQTNYRGLADAAIRASFNVTIPTRRWYKQLKEARATRAAEEVRMAAVETPPATAQPPPTPVPTPAVPSSPLVSQPLTEMESRVSRLEQAVASPSAAIVPLTTDQIAQAGSHLKTAGIMQYLGLGSILIAIPVAFASPELGILLAAVGGIAEIAAPAAIISAGSSLQQAAEGPPRHDAHPQSVP